MKLLTRLVPTWPLLTWVATIPRGSRTVEVLHGCMVEVADEWIVEAVWAGEYSEGDFDHTDLVFGSGIRIRGSDVHFVSAGSTLDRLWYCHKDGDCMISNSLPALLACSGMALDDRYANYAADVQTIVAGPTKCVRCLPCRGGDVHVVHFNNLKYSSALICEIPKPETAPHFADLCNTETIWNVQLSNWEQTHSQQGDVTAHDC